MSHELICAWLGLSPDKWPPDHCTLLGLQPGETDAARIEQHVHERLERVRRYQLAHPDQVTEAMNRLAQAYVALTDAAGRRPHPVSAPAGPAAAPAAAVARDAAPDAAQTDPLAWLFGPWNPLTPEADGANAPAPVLLDWSTAPPPARAPSGPTEAASATDPAAGNGPEAATAGLTPNGTAAQAPAVTDSAIAAILAAPEARRGLYSRRALYQRVVRTRRLLWAWQQVGKYLSKPNQTVHRPAEAEELTRLLHWIARALRSYPPLLGQAGQPGYHVVALARRQQLLPVFQAYLPSQRQTLARDWQSGLALLKGHRQFLHGELHSWRRRGQMGRAVRTFHSTLKEYAGSLLGLVGLAAVAIALNKSYPTLREHWPEQVLIVLALVGLSVGLWWDSLRRARRHQNTPVPVMERPAAARRKPRPQAS